MEQTTLKKCTKCGECKLATSEHFYKTKASDDGLAWQCKCCTRHENRVAYAAKAEDRRAYARSYREKNENAIKAARAERYAVRREELRAAYRAWRLRNIEAIRLRARVQSKTDTFKAKRRQKYAENADVMRERSRFYRSQPEIAARHAAGVRRYELENAQKVAQRRARRQKQRVNEDFSFAIKKRVSGLLRESIRRLGYTKRSRSHEILCCDWTTFASHIERQFLKGMTWDNRSEWHIDHIIPLSTAKTEEDVIRLNHYINLRPLWAKDNLEKSDKVLYLI